MNRLIMFLESDFCVALLTALLHSLWQGLVIAGLLLLYLRSKTTKGTNARYTASLTALVGIVLCVLFTWSILNYEPAPIETPVFSSLNQQVNSNVVETSDNQPQLSETVEAQSLSIEPASTAASSTDNADFNWKPLALVLWFAGVIIMLFRAMLLIAGGAKLQIGCSELKDEHTLEIIGKLRESLKITRKIRVAVSKHISVPGVIGFVRPILFLPASMLTGVPIEDLQAILAHELAHIKRYDYLVNFFQMVIEAILFFNPAVWWISRQIRIEREICCDNAGIATIGRRIRYAEVLIGWAKKIQEPDMELTVAAMGFSKADSRGIMAERIRRIVSNEKCPQLRVSWHIAIMTLLLSLTVLAGLWYGTNVTVAFAQALPLGDKWQKLNLESTVIAGATVHYEKSFEPMLPVFEEKYNQYLTAKADIEKFSSQKDLILADIDNVLGISETNTTLVDSIWKNIPELVSFEDMIFYLAKKDTIKDFLRAGGELPNFTYDKGSDTAEYNPKITGATADELNKAFDFVFPITSVETFEKEVGSIFEILQESINQIIPACAIQEIVKVNMYIKAKPTGPYWQWFNSGIANAITIDILKKHIGLENADMFQKSYNTNEYEDIKSEINLRYWMLNQFDLLTPDVPTEEGKRNNYARFAYATFEAQRLIELHGLDCVSKILDDISAKESRNGSDLIDTIKNITGEDMDARLDAYQTFDEKQQGIEKYTKVFNDASDAKDIEKMLFNLFRTHEVRYVSDANQTENPVEQLILDYQYAAQLLFKLGYEQEADSVMDNCIDFFSNPGFTNGRLGALLHYIFYALEIEKPLKAKEAAEELSKIAPEHIGVLTIQMFAYLDDKEIDMAKEKARKILSLVGDNEESNYFKAATSVLSINSNIIADNNDL